jgi:hypothetical protein
MAKINVDAYNAKLAQEMVRFFDEYSEGRSTPSEYMSKSMDAVESYKQRMSFEPEPIRLELLPPDEFDELCPLVRSVLGDEDIMRVL